MITYLPIDRLRLWHVAIGDPAVALSKP